MGSNASAPARSRKVRAQETKERLIVAAVELFSERHYDDVPVSEIAELAGVAHGALFHHFQSKRGIYLESMRRAASELDLVDKVQAGLSLPDQMQRLLELHLDYIARHRGLALRLVLGGRGSDPEAWELFEAGRWRIVEWSCNQLGLDPKSHAVRMMLRAGIGAIDEALVYWLSCGEPYERADMAAALKDLALNALLNAERLDPSLDIAGAVRRALDPE